MTFDNINDLMAHIHQEEAAGIKMVKKVLVYKSPVTQKLEYRSAYFAENFEANIWETNMAKKYDELKIDHHIYTEVVTMKQI